MEAKDLKNSLEIISAFQRGEEEGFDLLFREFYPALCNYAYSFVRDREQAEDIASQVFLKLWERHSNFTSIRIIRAYLFTSVRNECINGFRQQKHTESGKTEMTYLQDRDVQENIEEALVKAEVLRQLHSVLDSLPPQCKKIMILHFLEGKETNEIAREMELTPSTVRNQRLRGLQLLRKKISSFFLLFI